MVSFEDGWAYKCVGGHWTAHTLPQKTLAGVVVRGIAQGSSPTEAMFNARADVNQQRETWNEAYLKEVRLSHQFARRSE